MTSDWVAAAQVASGLAALAAVALAVSTARAARRVPMTDAYLGAWREVLMVLAAATERRDEPPPEDEADGLRRRFRDADHQLTAIEAALRVRVYGRAIRADLNNLLIDVLYDNPEVREVRVDALMAEMMPRAEHPWATCADEQWVRVLSSVPFASMLASQVWGRPGRPEDHDGLLRWYYPVVLKGLDATDSVTAPDAAPQQQLAFMLAAYVDSFLLPWIRDASREALMGRLGVRGYRLLWGQRRRRWRLDPPWRRRPRYPGPVLFDPTDRRA